MDWFPQNTETKWTRYNGTERLNGLVSAEQRGELTGNSGAKAKLTGYKRDRKTKWTRYNGTETKWTDYCGTERLNGLVTVEQRD